MKQEVKDHFLLYVLLICSGVYFLVTGLFVWHFMNVPVDKIPDFFLGQTFIIDRGSNGVVTLGKQYGSSATFGALMHIISGVALLGLCIGVYIKDKA